MRRGESRWYLFGAPDKRRPVLLLTREELIGQINEIIVVPVTRTVRGLDSEVRLSPSDGMPAFCALNLDHVGIAQRARVGAWIATLPERLWPDVERALLSACGFPKRGA